MTHVEPHGVHPMPFPGSTTLLVSRVVQLTINGVTTNVVKPLLIALIVSVGRFYYFYYTCQDVCCHVCRHWRYGQKYVDLYWWYHLRLKMMTTTAITAIIAPPAKPIRSISISGNGVVVLVDVVVSKSSSGSR